MTQAETKVYCNTDFRKNSEHYIIVYAKGTLTKS